MLNTVLIRFIRAPKDSKLMYIRVKLIITLRNSVNQNIKITYEELYS